MRVSAAASDRASAIHASQLSDVPTVDDPRNSVILVDSVVDTADPAVSGSAESAIAASEAIHAAENDEFKRIDAHFIFHSYCNVAVALVMRLVFWSRSKSMRFGLLTASTTARIVAVICSKPASTACAAPVNCSTAPPMLCCT